jgi:hypothetical protein
MAQLRCVDGSVLSVEPVSCEDRAGQPYEITLSLTRNAVPFAAVGQRCGDALAALATRARAARADPALAAAWPDPDDRFPGPDAAEPAVACGPAAADQEFFALRSRDRADPPGAGELRCILRSSAVWLGSRGLAGHRRAGHLRAGHGAAAGWLLTRRAIIEAWGAGGTGVRAVLTSAELVAFLDTVVTGAAGRAAAVTWRRPRGQQQQEQPGRVPDGIAQLGLPAVRAPARRGATAAGGAAARRGDVRRQPAVGAVGRDDRRLQRPPGRG